MEKVVKTSRDTIVYTLKVRNTDGTVLSHTAKAFFKDGRLIRTEAADPRVRSLRE